MKRIVTLGGGGGHSDTLKALRLIPDIEITAICPSTDSGGSTGVLRKEYGGSGYTGDLTKCIAALCPDQKLARALSFRHEKGPLQGHSPKNLLLHTLEQTQGREEAIRIMESVCKIGRHRVIPVTYRDTELYARLVSGKIIASETNIDTIAENPLWDTKNHAIADVWIDPSVPACPEAIHALKKADWIIVCPGDLYSSIIPTLLPKGVRETIKSSPARTVVITNIANKKGETDGYSAKDFTRKIENRMGRKADFVLRSLARVDAKGRIKSDTKATKKSLAFISDK